MYDFLIVSDEDITITTLVDTAASTVDISAGIDDDAQEGTLENDPSNLTEYDEAYYQMCACGHDLAACGVCGKGYGSKQADAVAQGIGKLSEAGVFYLAVKSSMAASTTPNSKSTVAAKTPNAKFKSTAAAKTPNAKSKSKATAKTPDANVPPKKMPGGWMFHGFFAFRLYASFADNMAAGRCEINILGLQNPSDDKTRKYGQNAARKEKEDSATFERTRDNNRGKSVNERIQLAMLEQQSVKNTAVMFEGQIFSL